ncbi:MAG: glycosyltransferase family 39 protein [Candidatus Hydrogenedentota bacterium]
MLNPNEFALTSCSAARKVSHTLYLLLCVFLLGLLARSWGLSQESPWYDEVVTLRHLDAPNIPAFLDDVAATGTPPMPVYFALEYLWGNYVGNSAVSLRLLSIIFGQAAILAIYSLGAQLFDRRAGLIAAFCLAASLVHVYFSQEIRMYAPIQFFAIMSVLALHKALTSSQRRWWIVNICFNVLLVWTHVFTILLIVAQAAYLLAFHRTPSKRNLAWGAAHVLLIGPGMLLWLRSLNLDRIYAAAEAISPITAKDIAMTFLVFAGGRASNEAPLGHLPFPISLDVPLAGLIYGLAAWAVWRTVHRRRTNAAAREAQPIGLLVIWLVLPPLLLAAASVVWKPSFLYRYVLFSSLALYLLAGAAISSLPSHPWRMAATAFLVCLYTYQLSGLTVGPFRPDWRAAGEYVRSHADPDDKLLVFQNINTVALQYSADFPPSRIQTIEVWSEICPAILTAHEQRKTTWLFTWLWADPTNIEQCFHENRLAFTATDFPSWPILRVYEIRPKSGL